MKKRPFLFINPTRDAEIDCELEKELLDELHLSKKYFTKNKDLMNFRYLALIFVILAFLLFLFLMIGLYFGKIPSSNRTILGVPLDGNTIGIFLGAFSLLVTSVFFFVAFRFSYTEYQKREYDSYYEKNSPLIKSSQVFEQAKEKLAETATPELDETAIAELDEDNPINFVPHKKDDI